MKLVERVKLVETHGRASLHASSLKKLLVEVAPGVIRRLAR